MAPVKILSSELIARIAAGEVVERPASVVKELVENALDAGATRVEVHLKEGGRTLIHIRDNGHGIADKDLAALFQRHATSKISSAEDLENVLSLGFRGEALYAVGSVAEVNVKSRVKDAAEAWELDVKGGMKSALRPTAMPAHGTEIRVNELFFNTPARKKFLKSDAAEMEQVLNAFLPYTLLFPDRHFVLSHNGRMLLDLSPVGNIVERVSRVLNFDAEHLVATARFEKDGFALSLVLGDINIQRPRRDLQFLFVNGRPVQGRNILFHVNDVYRLIMPEGVHPAFVIFLEVPPQDVDVNIHPAKREVRIRQESRFGSLLRAQVEQALMTKGGAKEMAYEQPLFVFPDAAPLPTGIPADKIIFASGQNKGETHFSSEPSSYRPSQQQPAFSQFAAQVAGERENSLKDRLLRARFIGTFARKYHLFEEADSLFVIDQHAAQERIFFEKFCAQITSGKVEVQRFLTPLIVTLTPQERIAFDALQTELHGFGIEATAFDAQAIAVHAAPALLSDPVNVLRSMLCVDDGIKVTRLVDKDVLARRACRASVMSGDRMQPIEAGHQLKALMACDAPFTCPHGRPVFVELRTSFLDRHFLRV